VNWVAVIRTDDTVANEPIWIRSDGECFVKQYGLLVPAESVPGFVKYERRPWRKRLLDTATLEVIEVPLFSLVNNKKGRPRRQNKAALLLIMRIVTADAFDFVLLSQSDSNTRRTLK
jgi:hypothetical protein